ncbi:MAG TPA: DUF115 domain-containing protein [Methanofastidiosum sp.]|nr:DUF115 domain-containing protein [Methanofastidiosum sp.]
MEEVLKKIYVKINFLFKKHFKKDVLINQIEKEIKEEKKKLEIEYKEKRKNLEKEKEKKFLANHIDFNLNSYRLIRYKDKHLGQRCFIIGNGPSLKAKDLEKIKGEFSFGANMIYKIFPKTHWRPTYYLVEDPLAYRNNLKEIKKIKCPKFVSDIALERMKLPLVREGVKFLDYLYYWDTYPKFPPLTVDFTQEVWCMYNVGHMMINAAIYMGFKEIYLLGMDFSYDFSGLTETKVIGKNGKEEIRFVVTGKVDNHFAKGLLKLGQEVYIADTKYALKGFEVLEKESKNLGIKIYNATRGGKLEVFDRIDLDTIFEKKNEKRKQ